MDSLYDCTFDFIICRQRQALLCTRDGSLEILHKWSSAVMQTVPFCLTNQFWITKCCPHSGIRKMVYHEVSAKMEISPTVLLISFRS